MPRQPDVRGEGVAGKAAGADAVTGSSIELARGSLGAWIDERDARFSFTRSRGPGGQAVNKLATRARLRVRVGDIHGLDDAAAERLRSLAGSRLTREDTLIFDADTFRGQRENRRACLERLRELVRRALTPPKVRKKVRVTKAMKDKRLETKRRSAERKRQRRWRRDDS